MGDSIVVCVSFSCFIALLLMSPGQQVVRSKWPTWEKLNNAYNCDVKNKKKNCVYWLFWRLTQDLSQNSMMGLLPLEFTECLTDSPYFRENLHAHEKELEKTSLAIKSLIKEVKDLVNAARGKVLHQFPLMEFSAVACMLRDPFRCSKYFLFFLSEDESVCSLCDKSINRQPT